MAHQEQFDFFTKTLFAYPEFKDVDTLLEIGSQDINGSVRSLFSTKKYIGIDLADAPGVDYVCAGELLELPDAWADVVVSTECFEHASNWKAILANAIRICKPNGMVLLTFAGLYRPAHGTLDSKDPQSSPFTSEYYKNIDMNTFLNAVLLSQYFVRYGFESNSNPGDSYFWGIRSSEAYIAEQSSENILLDRLARAQGQLGQALARLVKANRLVAEQEAAISQLTSRLGNNLENQNS